MEFLNIKLIKKIGMVMLAGIIWLFCPDNVKAEEGTKIHFISLYGMADAILLESNGHYGMVDSGEDWDYPDSEKYPLREGITVGKGYEQQVIYYLNQLGVEKLDFYIATHAHSDHIGSGDEILDYFPTDRLYISEYKDSYLYDGQQVNPVDSNYVWEDGSGNHLWDNQYVYDNLIEAAQENGTRVITNLDLPENEQYRTFGMGDMQIEILNYERERDSAGNILPVPDDNCNSLVTKVTAFGSTALLTSDMDPWVSPTAVYGDSVRVAQQLLGQQMKDGNIIDEAQVNTGNGLNLDLLKMSHHSIDYNNTTYFLTTMNPKTVVITGYENRYSAREENCMPDATVYATATDSAAVVSEFTSGGIGTDYVKIEPGWLELEGKQYYFDENGRTFDDNGNHTIDGVEYCFDEKGAVADSGRWVLAGNVWKYWTGSQFVSSEWIEIDGKRYYCDAWGEMVTGWRKIDGKDYYFISDGALAKDMWINGHYVDQNGVWIEKYSTAAWIRSESSWWYRYGNGEFPANRWETIDNIKYYFNRDGWMATEWQMIGGKWYYFDEGGKLITDAWIGDCYVDSSGIWVQELRKNQWIESHGRWWYQHSDGSYTREDWEKIDGSWYYFDLDGWMATGWQTIGVSWFYFDVSGKVATDTWIGDYYVDASGMWDVSRNRPQWLKVQERWRYRHVDGSYTMADWEYIDGNWYYFDVEGCMVIGWQYIDDKWYYMDADGARVSNSWVGDYFLKGDGVMATSEWVDGGRYYVDENGIWVQI